MKKTFLIIFIGIILYGFSLFNGFVWDDEMLRDTSVLTTHTYFRPITAALNSSLFTLFGSQPFIFHLFSVYFHIATAVLLFYLFKRFFRENLALFLSLLFLVHPSNVEAVCFASAMQEILFTFVGLAGLYLCVIIKKENYIDPVSGHGMTQRRRNDISPISPVTIFGAIIFSTLALLIKETGIVFLALTFLYLLLFRRKNMREIQLFLACAIIVFFTYVFARFSIGNTYVQGAGLFPIMRVSFATRMMNVPMIILYYLGIFFVPLKLGIAQNWVIHTITFKDFWLPLLVDVGFFGLVVGGFAKKDSSCINRVTQNDTKFSNIKIFIFFFLWFIIGLLPHVQIVALNMTVAERWMYFPMIGLLGMAGCVMLSVTKHLAKREKDSSCINLITQNDTKIRMIICTTIISLFFLRSFMRTLDWRSGLALYSSNISPTSSFDLQNNMGVELFRAGKYTEAKKYFEKSVALAPYWWVNWNNLGASYEREHNYAKAQECYEKSIHNGQYSLAYENLERVLKKTQGH